MDGEYWTMFCMHTWSRCYLSLCSINPSFALYPHSPQIWQSPLPHLLVSAMIDCHVRGQPCTEINTHPLLPPVLRSLLVLLLSIALVVLLGVDRAIVVFVSVALVLELVMAPLAHIL